MNWIWGEIGYGLMSGLHGEAVCQDKVNKKCFLVFIEIRFFHGD